MIPRTLAYVPRASLPQIAPSWLRADGSLDAERLLAAFVAFWRRHGQPLMGAAPYHGRDGSNRALSRAATGAEPPERHVRACALHLRPGARDPLRAARRRSVHFTTFTSVPTTCRIFASVALGTASMNRRATATSQHAIDSLISEIPRW